MLSKPLKAHRIYCTLYIFTELKCFEIIKAKYNLVMTEIFFNLGSGFYFSSLVASVLCFVLVIEFPKSDQVY